MKHRPCLHKSSARRAIALFALTAGTATAHSPICFCFAEPDDSVICEGGFSDGASAEGVAIRVFDTQDRVLIDGSMNASSEFSFAKPSSDFYIVFDAGNNHTVTVFADEIE